MAGTGSRVRGFLARKLTAAALAISSVVGVMGGVNVPAAEAAVTLTLSPTSGVVGTTVTATSTTGLQGNKVPSIIFDGKTISWSGTCKTTSAGALPAAGCLFAVPIDSFGSKTVQVKTGAKNGQTTFTVEPSISLSQSFGQNPNSISVSGTGFAKNKVMTATWDGSNLPLSPTASCTTGGGGVAVSNGSFPTSGTCVFTVPTGQASGNHTIVFSDGTTGGGATPTVSKTFLYTTASMTVPSSGSPGATITVTGTGFVSGQTLTLTWTPPGGTGTTLTFVNSGTSTPCTTNNLNSSGACTFVVPTGVVPAASGYSVAVSDGNANDSLSVGFTVSVGTATQVNITQDPLDNGGATDGSGNPIIVATSSFTVIAEVDDAGGNTVINDSSTQLQLGISTQGDQNGTASGGTLTGGSAVTVVNGVATWSSASIDKWGNNYVLQASKPGGGITSDTTGAFEVTIGTAAKLAVTSQPTAAQPGVSMGNVLVAVEDAGGNVLNGADGVSTASTASVSVASFDSTCTTATGTLGGTTTQSAVSGVATFGNLTLTPAGTYELKFTSGALTAACSGQIFINNNPPTKIVFATQPGGTGAIGGSALPTQPVVQFQDVNSIPTAATDTVTLTIKTSSSCAANSNAPALSGTTTASTGGGSNATFTNISLNVACTYVLTATANTNSFFVNSSSFTVGVGPETGLSFTTQPPSSAAAYQIFPVAVAAVDAVGNAVTGSTITGHTIQLSVPVSDNIGSGTVQGTTSAVVSASNGVASFGVSLGGGGLGITNPGAGYHLAATDTTSSATVTSSAFTVTITALPAKSLTIKKVSPNFGAVTGGNLVHLVGTGLTSPTTVKFGPFPDGSYACYSPNATLTGCASNLDSNGHTTIGTALVQNVLANSSGTNVAVVVPSPPAGCCPSGPGAVHVVVEGAAGADNSQAINTLYSYGPYIKKVNPNVVSTLGGTVTVLGGNMLQSKVTAVNFGTCSVGLSNVTWPNASGKTIKVAISGTSCPGLTPGGVKVSVTTSDGGVSDASYDTTNFSFEAPAVKKVAKNYGPAGGSTTTTLYPVKVLGKNFGTDPTLIEVRFGHSCVAVTGGSITDGMCTTKSSASSLTTASPAMAIGGTGGTSISVPLPPEDASDEATGIVDVQVCLLDGSQCSPANAGDRFAYAPVIKKVTSSTGKLVPVAGSPAILTIGGANLSGLYEVDFGGGSGGSGTGMVCLYDTSASNPDTGGSHNGCTGVTFTQTKPGKVVTITLPTGSPFHAAGTVNVDGKSAITISGTPTQIGTSIYGTKTVVTFA